MVVHAYKVILQLEPDRRRALNTAAAMIGVSPSRLVQNVLDEWLTAQGPDLAELVRRVPSAAEAFGQLPMPAAPAPEPSPAAKKRSAKKKDLAGRRRTRS